MTSLTGLSGTKSLAHVHLDHFRIFDLWAFLTEVIVELVQGKLITKVTRVKEQDRNRQTDRQTDRTDDRQTDRQTDRPTAGRGDDGRRLRYSQRPVTLQLDWHF